MLLAMRLASSKPEIVYARGKTVGVRYVSVGIQSRDNETEAMQLLAKHCGGRGYQVTTSNE
jgi:hypothetical protein